MQGGERATVGQALVGVLFFLVAAFDLKAQEKP
jgi:hypothetical protein